MNPQELAKDLRQKGWSEVEIAQTMKALESAPEQKGWGTKVLDQVVYWVFLLIALLGNFVVAVALVPFMLLVAEPVYLYPVVVIVAVTFGALFDNIIKDILDIPNAVKFMPQLFLPAIALMSFYIMVSLNNELAALWELPYGVHEPLLMGFFYTAGFMLPYYFTWQKEQAAEHPPEPPSFTRPVMK